MRLHTPARAALAVAALALTALVPVSAVGAEPSDLAVSEPTATATDSGSSVVDPASTTAPGTTASAAPSAEPTVAAPTTESSSATPSSAQPGASSDTVDLDLLGITDFHGHLEKTSSDPGAVTLACEVAAARSENPDTLLVSSGDNVGATAYTSSILGDRPTLDVLNAIGLTASAVGNHELDQGLGDLTGRIIPSATFPYLAANLSGDATLAAEGSGNGTYVTQVDGVRVGLVGVVTDELSTLVSPAGISSLTVNPAVATANARAAELKDGDDSNGEADVVVVLAHEAGEVVAAGVSDDVDVVFGGHTHVPFTETVTRADGSRLAVVQADHYGWKLGHVELSYDRATGHAAVTTTEDIDLQTSSCTTDAYGVAEIVSQAVTDAGTEGSKPLAHIATDFLRGANTGTDMGSNRGTESTAANLLADSFASWVATDIKPGGSHYVGVMNPGGVRADFLYAASGDEGDGVVTTGEAYTVQPFGNEMGYATLTGAQLRALLAEQFQPGASRPVLTLGLSSNVDVVLDQDAVDELTAIDEQIKAAADPQTEAATQAGAIADARSRVVSHLSVDGAELADSDTVVLASNSFVLTGGDGYEVLGDVTFVNTGVLDRDVTATYLQALDETSPAAADYVKQQVGMALGTTADGEVRLRMTGLTFSTDTEKNLGATSVRASVAGTELDSADIDTTPVANHPETGQATLTFTVPAGTATQTCTRVEAAACYVVEVDLVGADSTALSSYAVEVAAPGVVAGPTVAVSSPTVAQGSPITFTASGFGPGEKVTFTVASEVVTVGTATAGADGAASVTWTVPADFELGSHTVTATSASGSSAKASFTVVAGATASVSASGAASAPAHAGGGSPLARTGTTVAIGVVALVLVVGGGALLVARRRRP